MEFEDGEYVDEFVCVGCWGEFGGVGVGGLFGGVVEGDDCFVFGV